LSAMKLADEIEKGKLINFDVKAKMKEKARRSGLVRVGFALSVGTKPNVVKFKVEGLVSLEGQDEDIKKMLEADPETDIPGIFSRVYKHAFMSMYLLATLIQAPSPPANLLQSSQEVPTLQMESIPSEEETVRASATVEGASAEETGQSSQATVAPPGESTVSGFGQSSENEASATVSSVQP